MGLNLLAGYYAEMDVLCIVLLALLAFKTRASNFISSQKRSFEVVLLSHIAFSASDMVWILNNGFVSLTEVFPVCGIVLSYILNSLNVIFSGLTGFAWFVFSEIVQGHIITKEKKKLAALSAPCIVLAAATVTTRCTGFMFSVSEDGEFTRGIGYSLQVLVAMGYIICATVVSFRRSRNAATEQERKTSRAVVSFIIAPVITCILQLLLSNMQVMFIGTVMSLLSVYISLQQTQVLTDPLTGLNNRMLLDQKFNNAVQSWLDDYDLFMMLIDANDFKKINDEHGHLVGDKVLVLIADSLRKNCGPADYICRYGGDEFIILHRAPHGGSCEDIARKINETLASCDAPCPVSVSVGACRYSPDMNGLSELVKAADEEMYRVKDARKQKLSSRSK